MSKKLVIVESPAKAKTIGRFLGSDYQVEASVGHIRDLPSNRKGLPEELRKKWWADYAVDVDAGFEPYYEVPIEKKKYVDKLRSALKDADELILATDEDREGESISWHLLETLKPKKSMTVRRIAFHEITKDAILAALKSPRPIDERLVQAQEARRILDRLYGYTLSPVLWTKVAKELSAGRVQSPAVKLIVQREKDRRDFHLSVYWDLKAEFATKESAFGATLKRVDARTVAIGKDFDPATGELKNQKALLIDEATAGSLAVAAEAAKPWTVASLESTPGHDKQPPPFRTTTLQQEANRKFGFPADRTMRIAQDLYEGVDIGGERVGLITYMRTDSLNLAESAITQARQVIGKQFGEDHLPNKPVRYASKVANAQEAHEAIRPTDFSRTPDSLRGALTSLSDAHYKLYDLIYRRTLACQMKPAEVLRTQVEIVGDVQSQQLTFGASGKRILFPGFLLAYVEDVDDPEAEIEGKERLLPSMTVGQTLDLNKLDAVRHETQPPARYTDASLIKALEDLGIGRPSTYAAIISVIVDRGYCRKKGRELIPTFTAFLVVDVLDRHFAEFADLQFTAQMDASLDEIAGGRQDPKTYLREFFLGSNGDGGLKQAVESRKQEIPFPNVPLGEDPETKQQVIVRLGRDGDAFIQLGDAENKKYANVPEDIAPAELTLSKALELISAKKPEAESIGVHPVSGRRLLVKKRGNYYLEVERTPEEIEAKEKPTWVSLPADADPFKLTQEELDLLCSFPYQVGASPETGEEILFRIGKYGPYLQCGKTIRNFDDWRAIASLSIEAAMEILNTDKVTAARAQRANAGPIHEFGELEGATGPVRVLPGRFGPYVTDGTTNATIPKSQDPATITPEQAMELLRAKAAAGPSKKPRRGMKRTTTRIVKAGKKKKK